MPSHTFLQLKNSAGGGSCERSENIMAALFPGGYNDSTLVDDKTWIEAHEAAGCVNILFPGIIRLMTGNQQRLLIVWLLQKLSNNLPAAWALTPELQTKITDLIDSINNPTPAKKAALQTYSSSLTINYSDPKEAFMKDLLMRMINLHVAGGVTHHDVAIWVGQIVRGAEHVLGVNQNVVRLQVSAQMKSIGGL